MQHSGERERQRLKKLRAYRILDTAPEEAFDAITTLAAGIFGMPVALVSLVDEDRQWFKSRFGLDRTETPRAVSFCAHAIAGEQTMVVTDAMSDPRFADNPLVTGQPGIRFYAGAPLRVPGAPPVGTLCLIDTKPRPPLEEEERRLLERLAGLVVDQLELRLALRVNEERRRLLELRNRLSKADLEAGSFAETVRHALRLIAEECGATLAQAWSLNRQIGRMSFDGAWWRDDHAEAGAAYIAALREQDPFRVPSLMQEAVLAGRRVVAADYRAVDLARYRLAELALGHGLIAHVSLPMAYEDGSFVLTFQFAEPRSDIEEIADFIESALPAVRPVLVRKRAERELALLRSVIENTNEIVVITDGDFGRPDGAHVIYVNPAFERLTGYRSEEVIGRSPRMLHGPATESGEVERLANLLRSGRSGQGRLTRYRKDGSTFIVELDLVPVRAHGDWISHVVSVQRDVTAQHQAEERIRRSEASFRLMFESNPLPMWVYDLETLRFVEVNAAAVAHYGYSRAQFLERTIADIRPAEDVSDVREIVRQIEGRAVSRSGYWRHVKANGELITVEITSHPIDLNGRKCRLVVINDVTARAGAEEALRDRERRIRLLSEQQAATLDSLPASVALLDAEGRIVSCNFRWSASGEDGRLLGGALGRGADYLVHCRQVALEGDPDARVIAAGLADVLEGLGETFDHEFRVGTGDDPRWLRCMLAPVVTDRLAGAVIMYLDITPMQLALRQIAQAKSAAEAASRAKSDFLANMSHELRTPLNAINGMSELMRMQVFGPLAPKYLEYLADIHESGKHLLAIINDILDLSKIEAGTMRLVDEVFDLESAFFAVLRLVRGRADQARHDIGYQIDPPDLRLRADLRAIKQILLNLIVNAIKFSAPRSRIALRAGIEAESGEVVIAVEDNGIGMALEDIPRALEPFRQVGHTVKSAEEGAGLGLPLVKRLTELHGGRLEIRSRRGVGTTVLVRLPAGRVGEAAPAAGEARTDR
ncbi:MAG: PAS domain S-box protein [Alphaproteobacteria bacterium]|nr:PAS domain S-box protein [Alphaproteobacteria bacterium]